MCGLINQFPFFSSRLCVRSRVQQPHHQPLLRVRGHRERPERQQIRYDPIFLQFRIFQVQILSNISLKLKMHLSQSRKALEQLRYHI